jgi:hypothetical protein
MQLHILFYRVSRVAARILPWFNTTKNEKFTKQVTKSTIPMCKIKIVCNWRMMRFTYWALTKGNKTKVKIRNQSHITNKKAEDFDRPKLLLET